MLIDYVETKNTIAHEKNILSKLVVFPPMQSGENCGGFGLLRAKR